MMFSGNTSDIEFRYVTSDVTNLGRCRRKKTTTVNFLDQTYDVLYQEYGGDDFTLIISNESTINRLNFTKNGSFKKSFNSRSLRFFSVEPKSIKKLFEDVFFSKEKSKKNIDVQFSFSSSINSKRRYQTTHEFKRKRNLDSSSSLKLVIYVEPSPKYLFGKVKYHFAFTTLFKITGILSFLPDEMFLEVFKFLDTTYLLKKLNYVCRRFHKLVESDYMFQFYNRMNFPENPNKVNLKLSWKENLIMKYESGVITWKILELHEDEVEFEIIHKNRLSVTSDDLDSLPVFLTDKYVSSEEHHEWIVQVNWTGKEGRDFCNITLGICPKDAEIKYEPFLHDHGAYCLVMNCGALLHREKRGYPVGLFLGYKGALAVAPGGCDDGDMYEDDYGMIKTGGKVRINLKKGKLECEFMETKKKVSCKVKRNKKYCLCAVTDEMLPIVLEIVSFKKL